MKQVSLRIACACCQTPSLDLETSDHSVVVACLSQKNPVKLLQKLQEWFEQKGEIACRDHHDLTKWHG
jgi:hypothetical protein